MSIWTLVETGQHARQLVSGESVRDVRFLTASAEAYHILTSSGLTVTPLHSYLTFAAQNEIATIDATVAAAMCQTLDTALRELNPDWPTSLQPFDALLYQLKHVLDAVIFRYREFEQFLQTEQPHVIYFQQADLTNIVQLSSTFDGASSQPFLWPAATPIVAHFLADGAWVEELDVTVVASYRPNGISSLSHSPTLTTVVAHTLNPNRLTGMARLGLQPVHRRNDADRLTILGKDDDILAFVRHARANRNNLSIDWWSDWVADPVSLTSGRTIRIENGANRDRILTRTALMAHFAAAWAQSSPVTPPAVQRLLNERLLAFCLDRLPLLPPLYRRAEQYFTQRRPTAALIGTTTGDHAHVLAQAARDCGIPLVSFQHGGVYGYARTHQLVRSDLKAPSIFCSYGHGVTTTLQEQAAAHNLPIKVVTTGWDRQGQVSGFTFGRRRRKTSSPLPDSDKPILLYVSTSMIGNGRYGPHHRYEDSADFLHQIELAHHLAGNGDFQIIFKLHYKDAVANPLPDYLHSNRLDNIAVLQEMPLSALLPHATAVLLDWPSTTLLEALATGCPTLYLDRNLLDWVPEGRRLLQDAACWIDKQAGWQPQLDEALAMALSGQWSYTGNAAFLAAYGSADCDPSALWATLHE